MPSTELEVHATDRSPRTHNLELPILDLFGSDLGSVQHDRKRKRVQPGEGKPTTRDNVIDLQISDSEDAPLPKQRKLYVPLSYVRAPPLAFPKSLYAEHTPPMPQYVEEDVLQEILVGGPRTLTLLIQLVNTNDRLKKTVAVKSNRVRMETYSSTSIWKTSASIGRTDRTVLTKKSKWRSLLFQTSWCHYMRSMSGGVIPCSLTA